VRISHRHRFVFFSNPKAGSSTVRQLLDPHADVFPMRNVLEVTRENPFHPHMPPVEARTWFRRFGWDFDGYTKFVFVRNPWARLVSLYEHVRRNPAETQSFDAWLYSVGSQAGDGAEWAPWRRYGGYSIEHFVKDETGGILVDKVIRLEDIDQELSPFLTALGLPVRPDDPIPHRNRRQDARPYTAYYTPDTIAHVRDLYRYDVVTYGYEFGTPVT
jgi:hypothetical protein